MFSDMPCPVIIPEKYETGQMSMYLYHAGFKGLIIHTMLIAASENN